MRTVIVVGCACWASLAPALAQPTSTDGSLEIQSATVRADAGSATANVRATYMLRCSCASPKTVSIKTPDSQPANVTISAQETTVILEWQQAILGQTSLALRIDPTPFVNGEIYKRPVKIFSLDLLLPAGAKRLVSSTRPPSTLGLVGTRKVVRWTSYSARLAPETVHWTTLDIPIAIERTVSRVSGGKVNVSLTLTNRGSKEVRDLVLEQTFVRGAVSPIGPKGEFDVIDVEQSDPQIVWRRSIKLLPPRVSMKLGFTIRLLKPTVLLKRTKVMIRDDVIAVSTQQMISAAFAPAPVIASQLAAVPVGWDFNFTDDDHHIDRHALSLNGFSTDGTNVSWTTAVRYEDENSDDNYTWSASVAVLHSPDIRVVRGIQGGLSSSGGTATHMGSYSSVDIKGYSAATVVLQGWAFNYKNDDHHVKTISIRIGSISYNSTVGAITWRTDAEFADKNGDDGYYWNYSWSIIAVKNGTIVNKSFSGSDGGRDALHQGIVTDAALAGRKMAVVLPQGWRFRYSDDDHHLNEHTFRIRNSAYSASDGTVTWNAHLNYSDKNFDDAYTWTYDVSLIALSNATYGVADLGPYWDGGGADQRGVALSLATLFQPVTWTDGMVNGTETGVDCGGSSPSQCFQCLATAPNWGSATSAGLYSPNSAAVLSAANAALVEYAASLGQNPETYYQGPAAADRSIEAIAYYVEVHMEYLYDAGDWDGAQEAERTVNASAGRKKCSNDFCGDCEDFSILRASMLRHLNISPACIYSADYHADNDQNAKNECSPSGGKKSGGHTFNVVYYKGKYRILDYGVMGSWDKYSSCWQPHALDNLWNDHHGEWWNNHSTTVNGVRIVNFPGKPICPAATWDWRSYYTDICP